MILAARYANYKDDMLNDVREAVNHVDAFLKYWFQDQGTDPITVEALALGLANNYPRHVDDDTEFITHLADKNFTAGQAAAWYARGPANDRADVLQRGKNNWNNAPAGTFPADYNPYDDTWLVVNQTGSVTLDDTTPVVGTEITATVNDPDDGIGNREWQWQSLATGGEWTAISGATTRRYTPVTADVGKTLRCRCKYTDNANDDTTDKNTAISAATGAVVAS